MVFIREWTIISRRKWVQNPPEYKRQKTWRDWGGRSRQMGSSTPERLGREEETGGVQCPEAGNGSMLGLGSLEGK